MPALSNARALRVIGQDLEARGLKTFDIRRNRDRFEARCGYQAPPAATPVLLEYSTADIDELESRAQGCRRDSKAPLDLLSLSQMLRSLGGYFDSKNVKLLRVYNTECSGAEASFKIEGETELGEQFADERSASAIYDMGVNMYKQRGRLSERYARWRR